MNRLVLTYILIFLCTAGLQAQQNVGGPYEPDSATVLLMHFDGNLHSDGKIMRGGKAQDSIAFTNTSHIRFNRQVNFLNEAPLDSSYIIIPDTTALDLTGSWTIEYWIKPKYPRFLESVFYIYTTIMKPDTLNGDLVSNYSMTITFGSNHMEYASSGFTYADSTEGNLISVATREHNLLEEPKWYHVSFIRDSADNKLYQLVHATSDRSLPNLSDSLQLIDYQEKSFSETSATPITSDKPLLIGAPGFGNAWAFMGQMDELRISNTVRFEKTITSKITKGRHLPNSFKLKQNYPNPFNPSTNIRFSLPEAEQVTINVYNSIGQKIKTLVNRQMTTGSHSITFNAEGLPSGVYIYRLKAGEYSESRKMLLLK